MTTSEGTGSQRGEPERLSSLLATERLPQPPTVPLHGAWQVAISDLLKAYTRLPDRAAAALSLIDRMGRLSISPERLILDGDVIPWSSVLELRTASAVDVLTCTAIESELARLGRRLPPVPGRRWIVAKVSQMLIGLAAGALETTLPSGHTNTAQNENPVPMQVLIRGRFGRTREHPFGLFAGLVCASMPAVTVAVVHTAQSHGVLITDAPTPQSRRHAERVAETLRSLKLAQSRLGD